MASEQAAPASSAAATGASVAGPVEGHRVTTKGRGKRLTDSQRMEIIARLEDKTAPISRAKCARIYGVTPAAISKLMKVSQNVKKRYTDAGADAGNARDKRQRGGFVKNVSFEDELYQWICSVRARNIPLLVAHVQQKAKLLAHKHQMSDRFKASNGWYYRFCSRYGLTPATLHAGVGRASHAEQSSPESGSPSTSRARSVAASSSLSSPTGLANGDVKVFPKTSEAEFARSVGELQEQVANYGPEFVYNLSESRLFYQLLPSHVRPPPTPSELASSATGGATAAAISSSGSATSRDGKTAASSGASAHAVDAVGKTERVLLLVCANATGTHKIPLLVVGKDPAPPSLQALKMLHLTNSSGGSVRTSKALDLSTQYYSQREVWCDRHTFAYWCQHIFLPAIRQRTARPVLLIVENPGNHLEKFQQENVLTTFVPTRAQAGGANSSGSGGSTSSDHTVSPLSNHPVVRMQPMQCGVIRDLKRRYKIALFEAMLTFLERPDDERFRLHQRAMKKPSGCAGIAFGRPPHLQDAIRVLDGAWNAIPSEMVRECWVKSELTSQSEPLKSSASSFELEISDELVVLELCSMLRNVTVVDDMNALGKELRQWLNSDDDNSERMQQELLHDIQRLLQEEEYSNGTRTNHHTHQHQQQQQDHPQLAQHGEQHHQQSAAQDMMSLNMSAAQRLVAAGIDPAAAAAAMGFDPQFLYRTEMATQSRQAQPPNPAAPAAMDAGLLLREKQKAVAYALRSLAAAEEALDSPFVTEFFGEPTATAAMETVSHVLRELRRVQRGRQSTLMAAAGASSGAGQDEDAATTTTHEYFYGPAT